MGRAICRYLSETASSALIPATAKERAKMEQWISIETSEFSAHAMKFVYDDIFKRPQEAAVIEAAGKSLDATLAVMEKQLGKTTFLAGETFTLADIGFMPYIEYAIATPAKEIFAKHPRVMAWWNKISERPTWKKATGKNESAELIDACVPWRAARRSGGDQGEFASAWRGTYIVPLHSSGSADGPCEQANQQPCCPL